MAKDAGAQKVVSNLWSQSGGSWPLFYRLSSICFPSYLECIRCKYRKPPLKSPFHDLSWYLGHWVNCKKKHHIWIIQPKIVAFQTPASTNMVPLKRSVSSPRNFPGLRWPSARLLVALFFHWIFGRRPKLPNNGDLVGGALLAPQGIQAYHASFDDMVRLKKKT